MEAELIAMYTGAKEVERMQKILRAFEVDQQTPVPLLCNNRTVGNITGRLTHEKTKWIDIALKYTREKQEAQRINVDWVAGTDNVADLLTKPLSAPRVVELSRKLGMVGV